MASELRLNSLMVRQRKSLLGFSLPHHQAIQPQLTQHSRRVPQDRNLPFSRISGLQVPELEGRLAGWIVRAPTSLPRGWGSHNPACQSAFQLRDLQTRNSGGQKISVLCYPSLASQHKIRTYDFLHPAEQLSPHGLVVIPPLEKSNPAPTSPVGHDTRATKIQILTQASAQRHASRTLSGIDSHRQIQSPRSKRPNGRPTAGRFCPKIRTRPVKSPSISRRWLPRFHASLEAH